MTRDRVRVLSIGQLPVTQNVPKPPSDVFILFPVMSTSRPPSNAMVTLRQILAIVDTVIALKAFWLLYVLNFVLLLRTWP